MLHLSARQILKAVDRYAAVGYPQHKFSASVNCLRIWNHVTFPRELIDVLRVGCREYIIGRTVFDLLGELRGGAETKGDVDSCLPFKCLAHFREGAREIRGGGDIDFGARAAGVRSSAGRNKARQHDPNKPQPGRTS